MFGLMKELADRFIEFVLKFVKGDTVEEQLTSALKSAIFLIAVLGYVAVTTGLANINLRIENADMETGIAKMNVVFGQEDGGPLNSFIRINDSLNKQVSLVKQENLILFKNNITLTDENNFLRPYLVRALEENKLLKNNNTVLLNFCKPPKKKLSGPSNEHTKPD